MEKLKKEDCLILCSLKWVKSFPYITYSMISRYGSEGKGRIKTKIFLRAVMTEI